MTQDAFGRFVADLGKDAALRAAMEERFGGLSNDLPADDVIAFASERGYDFSVEEVGAELSDEALSGVAGGATVSTTPTESLSLYFLKVEFGYAVQGKTYDGKVQSSYDLTKNKIV